MLGCMGNKSHIDNILAGEEVEATCLLVLA
jgi:hypothetical protein